MTQHPLEGKENIGISGFTGIKKVKGLLIDVLLVDPPESWESKEKQAQILMGETIILEMFGDEEPFELRENKFNFYIPYKLTPSGKIAPNSIYNKCWLDSCEEVYGDRTPSKRKGEYITLEKQPKVLFETRLPRDKLDENLEFGLDRDGTKALNMVVVKDVDGNIDEKEGQILVCVVASNRAGLPNHFCFVADEDVSQDSTREYVRDLLVGLNQKAAFRKLLIDPKAKQHPEYKTALSDGTLAGMLELEIVDDKFQKPEEVKN